MLSEVLLVLSGHPSAFFSPSPSSHPSTFRTTPLIEQYLHPGETSLLNSLGHLAYQYSHIRKWAQRNVEAARHGILDLHRRKGKERERDANGDGCVYRSALAYGILDVLGGYERTIVDLETKILNLDNGIVQDPTGYVPLSLVMTTFQPWVVPLASLFDMIHHLDDIRPTPGEMIDILRNRCDTGHPDVRRMYNNLSERLERLFIAHMTTFVLYGQAAAMSTALQPSFGIELGADSFSPRYRNYGLDERLLPPSIPQSTRESMVYIGRVIATLQREGKHVPRNIIDTLREAFDALVPATPRSVSIGQAEDMEEADEGPAGQVGLKNLDRVVMMARREIGEWLWKYVLTGSQVIEALETYGHYLLTRRADHAISVLDELTKLRKTKLLLSDPHSSTSVIRDPDLHLAWLRSSLGTSAEHDRALDTFHLRLDQGPLRPIPSNHAPVAQAQEGVKNLFSSFILGAPITLHATVSWPLDLFISPQARTIYAEIHAYLFSLRFVHSRLQGSSRTLKSRRGKLGRRVERETWATLKLALFFLDELISHFLLDIIDVQHRALLASLEPPENQIKRSGSTRTSLRGSQIQKSQSRERLATSMGGDEMEACSEKSTTPGSPASTYAPETVRSRVPPTPNRHTVHLDFLTLRQIHSRHLAFLRQGLLLADKETAVIIRDILDVCVRLAGLIERWSASDAVGADQDDANEEGSAAIREAKKDLYEHLTDFFDILVQSQNPVSGDGSNAASGSSFSRTTRTANMIQSSRVFSISRQVSSNAIGRASGVYGKGETDKSRTEEAENMLTRHVEQLLLRLDYNGVFTSWIARDHDVTREGMLAEAGL